MESSEVDRCHVAICWCCCCCCCCCCSRCLSDAPIIQSNTPGGRKRDDGDEWGGKETLDNANIFSLALVDLVQLLHGVERVEFIAGLGAHGEGSAVLIEVDEQHARPHLTRRARQIHDWRWHGKGRIKDKRGRLDDMYYLCHRKFFVGISTTTPPRVVGSVLHHLHACIIFYTVICQSSLIRNHDSPRHDETSNERLKEK